MLTPQLSTKFKRDRRLAEKRGKDIAKLRELMVLLLGGQPLPAHYRDHALHGNWAGFREAHIEPDWLLARREWRDELQFARTGTYADIFG